MRKLFACSLGALICFSLFGAQPVRADMDCHRIEPTAERAMRDVELPPTKLCITRLSNEFPLPDPDCTPGAVNPAVTVDIATRARHVDGAPRETQASAQKHARRGHVRWAQQKYVEPILAFSRVANTENGNG